MYRLIFLFISFLYGIEIDTSIEKYLSKNDIKNRFKLADYYLDKNITKSKLFIREILQIDKKNKQAYNLLHKIKLREELNKIVKNQTIDKFYQNLFFNNKYDQIKKLSKYLPVIQSDYPKIITAKIYFWDSKYKKTKTILKMIRDKNSLDYIYLLAYLNFYNGYYKKAQKYFSILYSATYKLEYAYKLIECYIYLQEIEKANKLLYHLLQKYKDDKNLLDLKQKITKQTEDKIHILQKQYNKTHSFEDLQKLLYLLFNLNQNERAYILLEEYIKNSPNDLNAKYWYAKYLSWDGNNKKALKILNKIVTDDDYKTKLLIAKIYSWDGEYKKSINYLNDIITNANKDLVIKAKEIKGLIYYWQHKYDLAKPLLKEVLKYKKSQDAKEALMVMDKQVKPLIKKYKRLLKKDPKNLDFLLRLAGYSEILGDVDSAILYYEKYYNIKPLPKIAHKLANLYLVKKNPYKAFSYYEYWAYQKGDVDSLYELAKNYYYSGYNKSALSVINDILNIDSKYKKALQLKAKILRYSPKFTQENSTKTIYDIFAQKNSKLVTIGNRLYFNGFYVDASNYYKEYLLNSPNDAEIRERYAYSLEFGGKYKEASGEFFLLTWQKQDCYTFYHYGYTLQKSNKIPQAKKAYQKALQLAKKPLPKFLQDFINRWKKAWESQNINKYKYFYVKKYRNNPIWVVRKENIFNSVNFISLYFAGFSMIDSYKKDKYYYKVRFYQQYTTNKKKDKGYKTLLIECEEKDDKCFIADEKWQKGEYKPTTYRCYDLVNKAIENINKPKVIKPKKKN
jgi:tetratricopeptide (TPR) repeat protein